MTPMKTTSSGIAEGTLVAIPIPWESSASGCVEWRLVDWTVEDDDGQRLPILDDGSGEAAEAWARTMRC